VKTYLLHANMLLALAWPNHPHHSRAHQWMSAYPRRQWATCAITQSAFVRLSCNPKIVGARVFPHQAIEVLAGNTAGSTHRFWSEHPPVAQMLAPFGDRLVGYRQITDAYLLSLAAYHSGVLASLDEGLAGLPKDVLRHALELVAPSPDQGTV